MIATKIKDNWRFLGGGDEWGCDVSIVQNRKGVIQSVQIQKCVVDNHSKEKSFRKSIIRAINKASPLPYTDKEDVYDSNISIHLKLK